MIDYIFKIASYYWNSGLALWITLIIFSPVVIWQLVKRLPSRNNRLSSSRRRGKKNVRS